MEESTVIVAVIGISMALIEIIKTVVGKLLAKINGKEEKAAEVARVTLADEDRQMLTALYNWHNKEDSDGVKVWYFNRRASSALESIDKALTKLVTIQEQQAKLLEVYQMQLVNRLDTLSNKINDYCREIDGLKEGGYPDQRG